jgi:hypothetical protein
MVDFGLDDDFPTETNDSRPPERELVPEGDHDFQIRAVIIHAEEEKVEVRLEHPERRYGWVFARIPRNVNWGKRILSGLRTSLGYTREQFAGLELTDLAGRRVRARVYHKVSGARTFVNVGEFLPGEAAEPVAAASSKPTTRRTSTQKADAAAAMPDDDIPF